MNYNVKKLIFRPVVFPLLVILSLCPSSLLAEAKEITTVVESYEIIGESPLDKESTEVLLHPYTGDSVTLILIQEAVKTLQNKLREIGYGFYQVKLAPQTLDNPQIKISVIPLRMNEIAVDLDEEQGGFFSKQNILNSVPELQTGYSPNLDRVAQQVELGNMNAAKEINVRFSVNDQSGDEINADIMVNASKPATWFGWLDNSGSDDTGDYRLGFGYKNLNLFDKDHELSLTYTTSPDHLSEVQQYGINYRIPLYRYQGVWQLYGYYSDVDSGTVAGGFDVSGKGTFLGTKYEWHLPRMADAKKYTHQLVFGLDDRLFDNNVFFVREDLSTEVRSTPLSIAYKGKWKDLSHSLEFYLQYEHNLEVGSNNNDLKYALSRYNATPDWDVIKLGFTHHWYKKGYRLSTQMDFQYADQELISGEQFGLGGMHDKLRGFDSREVSGDDGVKGSVELWSPALWNNQMNVLGFIDAGYASRVNPLPNELDSDTLASTGIGAVWRWKQTANLSVYLAHVLDGNDSKLTENPTESGDNAIQFSLYMSY
ncbi:MAG: hypothetical protein KZQ83_07085 [gamma proteobacterium symbiont of Taylorina sp.]|nr:hypothetical protein [gamma proteobacterium symbiont of Taylorina sp.]